MAGWSDSVAISPGCLVPGWPHQVTGAETAGVARRLAG